MEVDFTDSTSEKTVQFKRNSQNFVNGAYIVILNVDDLLLKL